MRAKNVAIDKERKERAERVNGSGESKKADEIKAHKVDEVSIPMGRTQSTPAMGNGGPMIPLKTRVVQLLALGQLGTRDLITRVGGAEADVMRVVNVVSR